MTFSAVSGAAVRPHLMNVLLAGLFFMTVSSTRSQSLDLPQRPPTALNGAEFARSIATLSAFEREERILSEVRAGNVPSFLRTLVPVTVKAGGLVATYRVAPDYLSVGSDDDYVLMPLTPYTAQTIADRLGCTLPTTKMVDDIYACAPVKLSPSPIPPSREMTTLPVFLLHNETVLAQRKGTTPGVLVAGHKKDVVISEKVFATPGKVAIYGWHKPDGKPIQSLYTGHSATWVDYSHGIRLVLRRLTVDGESKTIEEVLNDPRLAPLLSDEGVMPRSRYPLKASPALTAAPGETIEELRLDLGVRIVINRPVASPLKPVLLVFYAVPNGNTIEQTIGKVMEPGDDWHLDIQHIGAQTRFLRQKLIDQALVVAYLENDLKSWPAWRKKNGDTSIPAILDAVRGRFDTSLTRLVLSGHSGGGSLTFGYLNSVRTVPDHIERIAFLDSNYGYESGLHLDKLNAWLNSTDRHYLVVLAYDDAVALLEGKPFVSASGGTWGRSQLMLSDLEKSYLFNKIVTAGLGRFTALDGRVCFLLKENPERKVFHTVQVARNGFIESLLTGTGLMGVGYTYFGDRSYTSFIRAD